jgi:hypothetical protein
MHHAELLREAEQAFRMANKEVSAGIQAVPEFFDQPLLLGFVKINHHVATQNYVVAPGQEFGLKVVEVELNQIFQLFLYCVFIA